MEETEATKVERKVNILRVESSFRVSDKHADAPETKATMIDEGEETRRTRRLVRDIIREQDCERAIGLTTAEIETVSEGEQAQVRALRVARLS